MSAEGVPVSDPLANVIAAHQIDRKRLIHDGVWCDCGQWSTGRGDGARERYAAHVAEVVRAHLGTQGPWAGHTPEASR